MRLKNIKDIKDYIMDALAVFDDEECIKHKRNNNINVIYNSNDIFGLEKNQLLVKLNNGQKFKITID